jgi:CRP/FNR family transcriptional regulator
MIKGDSNMAHVSTAIGSAPPPTKACSGCSDCRFAPTCLPAEIAGKDRKWLRRAVRPLPPLARNQELFHSGDPRRELFIVRSGCLCSSVQQANGDEQILDFHLPGDMTGFGTGIETFRGGRITALEHSAVCAVQLDTVRRLATRIPGLQEQLYSLIEAAMVKNEHHIMMMGQRSARGRVALFLHAWSRRQHNAGFSGTDLHLPMRREDLASFLGLVTETASRAVSSLRQAGVITVRDRHCIEVRDAANLAAIAGIDP